VTGTKIVAINGATYSEDAMKAAITAAKGNDKPITLVTQRGEKVATMVLNYHDGLRYPWLEKAVEGKEPAGLDLLLSAKRPGAK
jgi:hypothetical protein